MMFVMMMGEIVIVMWWVGGKWVVSILLVLVCDCVSVDCLLLKCCYE